MKMVQMLGLLRLLLLGICGGRGMSQLIYPDQFEMMRRTSTLVPYSNVYEPYTNGPQAYPLPGVPRTVNDDQKQYPGESQIPTFVPTRSPVQSPSQPPGSFGPPRPSRPPGPPRPRGPPAISSPGIQNALATRYKSQNSQIYETIYKGVTRFALKMNEAISRETATESNVVFSPLNVATALAMVLLGSAGRTFDEAVSVLGFDKGGPDVTRNSELYHQILGLMLSIIKNGNPDPGAPRVHVANGLFVQEGHPIRQEYLTYLKYIYNSDVFNLDFHSNPKQAQEAVNAWVSAHTMGKIPRILDAPRPSTSIILASALYFKGEWNQHFIEYATKRKAFFIEANKVVDVDMMFNGGEFPFYEDHQIGAKIMALPYKKFDFSMYIVLPKAKGAAALKDFASRLTEESLEYLIENMRRQTCIIGLPRMKFSSSLTLNKILQNVNLRSIFDPVTADLSVLSPGTGEQLLSTRSVPNSKRYPTTIPLAPSPSPSPPTSTTPSIIVPKVQTQRPKNDNNDVIVFPRFGSDDESSKDKMRNYFMYEDQYGGYSVEQWATGFLIKRLQRLARMSDSDSDSLEDARREGRSEEEEGGGAGGVNRETRTRSKRQTRPEELVRFIESQNLTSLGLDDFRNNNRLSNPHLFADEVLHKVEIEVTETGTEAAASTSVVLERDGSQKRLLANRPFLFFIRHDPSKLILFWGSVSTPTPNYPST